MRRILSIDGGGLRGIIPCSVLIALEKQTGKLTRELFDMVAGTSTGALLAAAVAAGIPAEEILKIYTERSREIFGVPFSLEKMIASGHKYEISTLSDVLSRVLGPAVIWTLNDSPIRLLLTAMGANRHPWYFVKDNPKNAGRTGKLSLRECALASAAAPTYFPPYYVSPRGGELIGWCFDGGVGVTGNPVYQAAVEAFEYDDFTPAETRIVSLGTGFYPATNSNPPSGLLATISWTVDSLISAAEDQQTQIVNRHYPGILTRLNWQLPHAIDMADLKSIPDLLSVGLTAAHSIEWNKLT